MLVADETIFPGLRAKRGTDTTVLVLLLFPREAHLEMRITPNQLTRVTGMCQRTCRSIGRPYDNEEVQ